METTEMTFDEAQEILQKWYQYHVSQIDIVLN
jgi:hypothetical protein